MWKPPALTLEQEEKNMDWKHTNYSKSPPVKIPSDGEGTVTFTSVTDKKKPKSFWIYYGAKIYKLPLVSRSSF